MKSVTSVVFDLRSTDQVQESSFKDVDTLAWALYEMSREIRYTEYVCVYLKKDKAIRLLIALNSYFSDKKMTIVPGAFNTEEVIISVSYDGNIVAEPSAYNGQYVQSCALITLLDEDCKQSLLEFHINNLECVSIFSLEEDIFDEM